MKIIKILQADAVILFFYSVISPCENTITLYFSKKIFIVNIVSEVGGEFIALRLHYFVIVTTIFFSLYYLCICVLISYS